MKKYGWRQKLMVKCNKCKEQIKGKIAYFNTKPYCTECYKKVKNERNRCSIKKTWLDFAIENAHKIELEKKAERKRKERKAIFKLTEQGIKLSGKPPNSHFKPPRMKKK